MNTTSYKVLTAPQLLDPRESK